MAADSSCCPEGSLPALQTNYSPRGEEIKVNDLDVYIVGSGTKAVVAAYDIYGFRAGRTRAVCDQLADEGFLVLLPDFFRGTAWVMGKPFDTLGDWLKTMPYETGLKEDFHDKLLPYLKGRGVLSVGMVGFCWGAWLAFNVASTRGSIACAASFHPSLKIAHRFGSTEEELARGVTCPQLLLPAGNDAAEVREGGVVIRVLQSSADERVRKSRVHSFPDMVHGYAIRADINVASDAVKRDVANAFKMAVEFLKEHM